MRSTVTRLISCWTQHPRNARGRPVLRSEQGAVPQLQLQTIQTEHFDIYYYRMSAAARSTRRAWPNAPTPACSRILHHTFQSRKPIILYASQSDFQQTNVVDASGEGLGG